jgi:hypothetical protein
MEYLIMDLSTTHFTDAAVAARDLALAYQRDNGLAGEYLSSRPDDATIADLDSHDTPRHWSIEFLAENDLASGEHYLLAVDLELESVSAFN